MGSCPGGAEMDNKTKSNINEDGGVVWEGSEAVGIEVQGVEGERVVLGENAVHPAYRRRTKLHINVQYHRGVQNEKQDEQGTGRMVRTMR
jgi:hypothetical protein